MSVGTLIVLGIVEQILVFTVVLPATGWWFSWFGVSAVLNLPRLFQNAQEPMTEHAPQRPPANQICTEQ